MATASMQNRNNPRQQQGQSQQGQQQGPAKFKSPTPVNPTPPHHHRDSSNDRQENKPTWGKKSGSTTAGGSTSLVNRATTPSNQSRTNSPAPANTTTNAWTVKADERTHDQFTHLLYALTSQSVLLHTRSGKSYTGILTSFDLDPELALVLSHVLPHPLPDPAPAAKKQYIVSPKEISSITATQVSLNQSNNTTTSAGFRTDIAISGAAASAQRALEKWQPDPVPTSGMSGSLEHSGGATWDQFATNERMFGVKSSYSEEIYTTKLDRSHPEFEKRLRHAESIAREIEAKASTNPHLQEERNQKVDDSGIDEEDKYAGVIRNQQNPTPPTFAAAAAAGGNKYTPPAKRAEAKTAVVSQIDPAIISSKIRTEPEKPTTVETKPALSINPPTNGAVPVVKEPEDTTPQIQEVGQKFVKEEKVKIKRARNLIGTKEKQRQFAEFAEFSNSLTLNMPVPSDLLPILAGKDAAKQKAILERNQEIKRRSEEQKAKSPSVSPAILASQPTLVASPVASPGPTLAERLKANQNRASGSIPSPIASPTPLDPGAVKSSPVPKKLDPSAKEFVFKVSAKEFKPSYAAPSSTHSPSPSRSSVVSPPPTVPTALIRPVARVEAKPQAGFWDKKQRRDTSPKKFGKLGTFSSDKSPIAMAFKTHPAWSLNEGEDQNAKGYLDVFTEPKSSPATPTSGQDDHSQSGHSYSRSSSGHPHHSSPHPPQPVTTQQPVVQSYATGHPMYPPMGAVAINQYPYMIPQPQQVPMHPQQAVQPGFAPQLMPGQFQQHNQYPRFQGYQSVSPSPLMQQHAIPAQYPPQQPYPNNSQFPQGYPTASMYPGVPPYGYVPQQQNGVGFSGHPSPGRTAATQAMLYQGMPQMNMQPQLYQDPNLMRQPFQPQPQMSLRTPPQQPHIHPHQGGYQHSPSRNSSYASAAGHPTPSHSRRQSTQPPPEDDK